MIIDSRFTNESQIRVNMTSMNLISETGGSPIISYSLEWDEGSSRNYFVPIIGYYDNNMQLYFDFTQLTKGVYYSFKYRVKNIYGWS